MYYHPFGSDSFSDITLLMHSMFVLNALLGRRGPTGDFETSDAETGDAKTSERERGRETSDEVLF